MQSTHESLQEKVGELFHELKTLSENYKLEKLNLNIILVDTKNNKKFTFDIDEKLNFSVSSSSSSVKIEQHNLKPSESEKTTEDLTIGEISTEQTTEQRGGKLFLVDNTLSSGIFNTSMNSEDTETLRIPISTSDVQSTISEKFTNKKNKFTKNSDIFKGGFKKNIELKKYLSSDLAFSPTSAFSQVSELKTVNKHIFNTQKGGNDVPENTKKTDKVTEQNKILSTDSMSATSYDKPEEKNEMDKNFSPTSLSDTSIASKNLMQKSKNNFSETSAFDNNNLPSNVSATSNNSSTSDNSDNSDNSDTSAFDNNNLPSDVSATSATVPTSRTPFIPAKEKEPLAMKGGFTKSNNIETTLSKMDLIRQKIRELESITESDIFQKNKISQSGGGDKRKNSQSKQIVGINSSSTSSLCE